MARGGTGVRALVGDPYLWSGAETDDPGAGCIGADDGLLRFSKTDRNGLARYLGARDMGTDPFYPGRIELASDPKGCHATFTSTTAATDHGTWRSQPVTITGTAGWPPKPGAKLRLYAQAPRMAEVFARNIAAAFDWLGLHGAHRRFDRVFIWPTEADLAYAAAYESRDFDLILAQIAAYMTASTSVLMVTPWPYGTGIETPRLHWYAAIRRIAARDPARRTLVSLDTTGIESWDPDDNAVHVAPSAKEEIGYYIRRSEEKGGVPPIQNDSGVYIPTLTVDANIAGCRAFEAMWTRLGDIVTVCGRLSVNPADPARMSLLRLSLPIASDLVAPHYLAGVASCGCQHGMIEPGSTRRDAGLALPPGQAGSQAWHYSFSYRLRWASPDSN